MNEDDMFTLTEALQWFEEQIDQDHEAFPGDPPEKPIETLRTRVHDLGMVLVGHDTREANENMENPTDEQLRAQLEAQCVDVLAGLAGMQRTYDLDIAEAFWRRKVQTEATQEADSVEELQELLEEAGMDVEVVQPGVATGDTVDRPGYEPDDRTRGIE